ncbi:MAG: EamA family transporter [Spirochaetia bacterium]
MDPRRGYLLAALNMVISGVAIYVNSLGVKMFADSTLYTALKNAVAGIALLLPLAISPQNRTRFIRLAPAEVLLLVLVALIGGSVSYALYFRGLQISTPVTASLIDHTQFLFVAVFAALFLRERFGPAVWAALGVLLVGLTLGVSVSAVRVDSGLIFISAATLLFAGDFVLMKHLLRSVSPLIVMTFKMSLGSLLLFAYVAASGRLVLIRGLSPVQWDFVLVTGLILLAFTATSVLGLRGASATAVTAIPAGAPIITTALVLVSSRSAIPTSRWLGLSLVLLAVLGIFVIGQRQERGTAGGPRNGSAA